MGRIGVISATGLLGLLVGVRRGRLLKRVLYTTAGGTAGAAFCYPDQATEIAQTAYEEGRKQAMVAYNFIAGDHGGSTPSLTDISSKITNTDMSLIASGLSRSIYWIGLEMKDVLALGQKQAAVLMELVTEADKPVASKVSDVASPVTTSEENQ